MIVINFKNYVTGKKALKLAKLIQKHLPSSIICPSNFDVDLLSLSTRLKVYSQNVDLAPGNDSKGSGRKTGFQTIDSLKKSKIKGSLLNHSEHPISKEKIKAILEKAKKYRIRIILCVPSIGFLNSILRLKNKPYAIAFEDPKLISTGKSITRYNKTSLKNFVKTMRKTKIIPLCGAGISTKEDYWGALRLGCKGVLISSAIAKSKNPRKLLKGLSSTR